MPKKTKTGKILESIVEDRFSREGFDIVMHSKWKKNKENYSKELLLKNVPYKTIYGHDGRTEFLLLSEKHNLRIRIECKWQEQSGSADEKLPYLYLNAIEKFPERDVIILIAGPGFKKGSIPWLKHVAQHLPYTTDASHNKNIMVFSQTEFTVWANSKFI